MQLTRLLEFQITKLPHWVLTDSQPAFYDTESGTAIQQTSRVYAKIQELIRTYNEFVTTINQYIHDFENGMITNFDCFKNCVIETMNDYIQSIDQKIELQNLNIEKAIQAQNEEVDEAVKYMKTNLENTVNNLFYMAIQEGAIQANLKEEYNQETESLNISIVAEEVYE